MNEQKFHVGIKALIVNDENEVLILKGDDYWDLPGGRIGEGDSEEETLRKEIVEELGINKSSIKIICLFHGAISNLKVPVSNEKFGLVLFVYLCKLTTKKEFTLSFEHRQYRWASISEAKKLLSVKFAKSFIDKLDDLNKLKLK